MMRFGRLAIAVLTVAALATGALGSGGPPPMPDYVTSYAQDGGDLVALSSGRLGIMKGAAPSSVLYLDWRLLNGLSVGDVAGKALATPCCDEPSDGVYTWLIARRRVPSAAKDVYFVSSERSGPNYTSIPTCFNDAFVTAAATLDDRIARYGDASPAVGAWLATRDGDLDERQISEIAVQPRGRTLAGFLRGCVGNSIGMPPAAWMPALTRSARTK